MRGLSLRGIQAAVAAAVAAGISAHTLLGYEATGLTWPVPEVVYFVNPQNAYVPDAAAIEAIRTAAGVWSEQSRANIRLTYGGTTDGASATLNFKNEVFFRDATGGGQTFWWYDGSGHLIDADIVIYERGRPLFTGSSGCTNGIYIEDLVTHEFGHVLGLLHSAKRLATMYATTTPCSTNWRTLSSDDIAGIESLYPPVASSGPEAPSQLAVHVHPPAPASSLLLSWRDNADDESWFYIEQSTDGVSFERVAHVIANTASYVHTGLSPSTTYFFRVAAYNSADLSPYSNVASARTAGDGSPGPGSSPVVWIASPASGAAYDSGETVDFVGIAIDEEDGALVSTLTWTSSLDGPLGTGSGFSRTLSPGTHAIEAHVRDSDGLTGAATVSVTIGGTPPEGGRPHLSAHAYLIRDRHRVDLTWSWTAADTLDVYRNGIKVRKVRNDGSYTDVIGVSGEARYSYRVCETGAPVCSSEVIVAF